MSDLYNSFFAASWWSAPVVAFLIGAAGSLHCVGMCGGLALAVNKGKKDAFLYNGGRLLGYLSLVVLFAIFGASLNSLEVKEQMAMWGGLLLGAFFLLLGYLGWQGKEFKMKLPFMEKLYSKFFRKSLNLGAGKSFGVGYSSIFLPCALSYTFIIGSLSVGNPVKAAALVLFFWLGTLPAMVYGPAWTRAFLNRAGISSQRTQAALFLIVGVVTVTVKVIAVYRSEVLCLT